jgi:hypothetical protein
MSDFDHWLTRGLLFALGSLLIIALGCGVYGLIQSARDYGEQCAAKRACRDHGGLVQYARTAPERNDWEWSCSRSAERAP